jgi:uncharacterized membrane protein
MILLPVHIAAGLTAIASGYIALYAQKGGQAHRRSGIIFVYAMLIMASAAVVLAVLKSQTSNVIGGSMALYLVITGLRTLRRTDQNPYSIDTAAMFFGIVLGCYSIKLGIDVSHSASGKIDGMPPTGLFIFGAIALLAGAGDIRLMLMARLPRSQRLVRDLWRMCGSMFVATGSFFLGQAKVFPKPMRIIPLLAIPAVLPLVLMIYYLVRVWFTKWRPRRIAEPVGLRAVA